MSGESVTKLPVIERPPIYPAEWEEGVEIEPARAEINVPAVQVHCERCGSLAAAECLFVDCPWKLSEVARDENSGFCFWGS